MDQSRLTRYRRAVLAVIRASDDHPNAAHIFLRVQRKHPRVAYATIYNALDWLSRHGAIGEIKFGDGASRYDGRTSRHDHLVCRRCGRLTDVEISLNPRTFERIVKDKGFMVKGYHVQILGLCFRCRKHVANLGDRSTWRRTRSLRRSG